MIPDLLAAYAFSGCNTRACYFGIVKTQKSPLSSLGDPNANMEDVFKQSSNYITACFSVTGEQITTSFVRQKVWSSQIGRAPFCAPKLCSLPLTSEYFAENVKRAHLQACVWKQATELDLPELNPVDYGWEKNEAAKSLNPVMLPKISNFLDWKCYNYSSVLVEVSLPMEP